MYDIDTLPGLIELGNLNELGVSLVEFDVTDWLTLYPLGTFNITYIRPGETDVYPVDATGVSIVAPTSGNLALALADEVYTLTWTVSDAVTAITGSGSVVVELTEDGTVKKRSAKTQTYIADGHAAAGDPPEPLADYIEKWGAVDLTLTEREPGEELTQGITQNGTGTHIDLQVHKGAKVASAEFDGDDILFTLDDLSEVRIVGGKTAVTGAPGIQGLTGATGATGADGMSAYAAAVLGGYNGTLEDFYADFVILNELQADLLAELEAI